MTKVMELYVLPTITHCATTISAMFDLWMSRIKFDTFAHIINDQWVYTVAMLLRLFEVPNTSKTTLAKHVKYLSTNYQSSQTRS
jgi:hypothetical protein